LGKHIARKPTIVSQNMNSAGGLTAADYLYNRAAKDGTFIGTFQRNLVLDSVIKDPGAQFLRALAIELLRTATHSSLSSTGADRTSAGAIVAPNRNR
jgi:hypothetical protein